MVNQGTVFLMLIALFKHSLAGFIETPSSITVEFVSGVDRTVEFRCQHDRADAIIWKLNGSSIRDYDGIMGSSIREDGILVDTLSIPVIPAYNRSEVVCSALVDGSFVDTPAAVLTITESTSSPMTTTPSSATAPLTTPSPTTPSPTARLPTTPPTGGFVTTPSLNIVAMEKEMLPLIVNILLVPTSFGLFMHHIVKPLLHLLRV